MKRLTILRHAKSSWGNPDADDFDRPLNGRGWKAARQIGRELKKKDFRFDLVLASRATRVRETIEAVGEQFDLPAPVQFEQGMYLASCASLLSFVQEMPENVGRPLLIGHNPGLQQLLLKLTCGGHPLRERIRDGYPTAAVAVVDLAVETWREVESGCGEPVELILPRELG